MADTETTATSSKIGFLPKLLLWSLVLLFAYLYLGAVQRHVAWGLVIHISLAAVVWMLASVAGARGWWLWPDGSVVSRLGKTVLITGGIQVLLGLTAYGWLSLPTHTARISSGLMFARLRALRAASMDIVMTSSSRPLTAFSTMGTPPTPSVHILLISLAN